jgi:hypothetical protein
VTFYARELVCWVPHTPILRVGLEPNPHVILSAAKDLSSSFLRHSLIVVIPSACEGSAVALRRTLLPQALSLSS